MAERLSGVNCGRCSEPSPRIRDPRGQRDTALLAVLYGTGVRRSEAVALDLSDYTPERGELRVRSGKGRKERIVYVAAGTAEALAAWLAIRGEGPGALFHPITKGGQVLSEQRLGDGAVRRILRRRARQAGIAVLSPTTCAARSWVIKDLSPGAPVPPILPPQGRLPVLDKAKFPGSFAADVEAEKAAFLADSQVPWGVRALNGTICELAWKAKPSWYLVVTEGRMIPPAAQRAMAKRAGSAVVKLKGSHAIYVSQPEPVAVLIEQAAKGVTAAAGA